MEHANGAVEAISFGSKTERNQWLTANPGSELVSEEEKIVPEPESHAYHGVKRLLGEIVDETGSANIRVILSEKTGAGNFRQAIAKQAPYKGNRKQPRPFHYDNIRDYLVRQWDAVIVQTREADDEIAIQAKRLEAAGHPHVVASIDKDLDQIPGEHYDYAKKVGYFVGVDDARRYFWIQALAGDPTDNIPGCWKVGPTKAAAWVDDWLKVGLSDQQIFAAIIELYERSKKLKGCPYPDRPGLDVALETAQLVWMQDTPGEIWAPPGVPRGRIQGELDD